MRYVPFVIFLIFSASACAETQPFSCDAQPLTARIGIKEKIPAETGGSESGWVRRSDVEAKQGCIYTLKEENQFVVFTFPKTVRKNLYERKCTLADTGEPVPFHFHALSKEGILNGADIIIQCPADKARYPEQCSYKKRRQRHSELYQAELGADRIMVNYGLKTLDVTRPGSEDYAGRKQLCVLQKSGEAPGTVLAAFEVDALYPSWYQAQ